MSVFVNPHLISVARDGVALGEFSPEQIQSRLRIGVLLPSDHFFDNEKRTWRQLAEWASPRAAAVEDAGPEAVRPPEAVVPPAGDSALSEEEDEARKEGGTWEEREARQRKRSSRGKPQGRRKRQKHPASAALPGWIACLFAVGAAVALYVWAQEQRDTVKIKDAKLLEMGEQVEALKRKVALLDEMSPAGILRGVLVTESAPGKLAFLSGVTVAILRAEDARPAILRMANEPAAVTEGELAAQVTQLQALLPAPLAVTVSDSSGRFEFALPEPGNYILFSTFFLQASTGPSRLVWLIEIENTGEPAQMLSLSEKNAITLNNPAIRIRPARAPVPTEQHPTTTPEKN